MIVLDYTIITVSVAYLIWGTYTMVCAVVRGY